MGNTGCTGSTACATILDVIYVSKRTLIFTLEMECTAICTIVTVGANTAFTTTGTNRAEVIVFPSTLGRSAAAGTGTAATATGTTGTDRLCAAAAGTTTAATAAGNRLEVFEVKFWNRNRNTCNVINFYSLKFKLTSGIDTFAITTRSATAASGTSGNLLCDGALDIDCTPPSNSS